MGMTPASLKAEHNRAVSMIQQKRPMEAEQILRKLLIETPFDAHIHYNLGNALWEQRGFIEAMRTWRTAIACDPNFVPSMVNLSNALDVYGDRHEALRYAQMALRRTPNDPRLLTNLASILMGLGEGPHAWEALKHAHEIAPNEFMVAHVRMACAVELRLREEIEGACLAAKKLWKPGMNGLVFSHLATHFAKLSKWDELAALQTEMLQLQRGGLNGLSPMLACFSFDNIELAIALSNEVRDGTTHFKRPRPAPTPKTDRITIGYLSPDLRNHPVAHMILPILRMHDRTKFKAITIGTLPNDHSTLSKEIQSSVEGHLDISRLDDTNACEAIRTTGVDILVDLAGSTQWHRPALLGLRPCRTQLLWLGCPSTTALPVYDGFLLDKFVITPEYRPACTEPIYELNCCYHPIHSGQGSPNPSFTRSSAGLPQGKFIIGLLQMPTKVRPPFTEDLTRILQRLPEAVLWMRIDPEGEPRIKQYFSQRGIDPGRIIFSKNLVERDDYLAYFGLADLLIDSFPYGGHSTVGEALSLGHPVVTRVGSCIHTRVGGSMLHHMGLHDLITTSNTEFIDQICRLAESHNELNDIRIKTKAAAAKLRETGIATITRQLEEAYLNVHLSQKPTS